MGRQVNFYMTNCDEHEFVSFVSSERQIGIFTDTIPNADISPLTEFPSRETLNWRSLWLWDLNQSLRPKVDYVPEHGYYAVDCFETEKIQPPCGLLDEGRLVRGRIWAEISFL